jgi:hypothetical protein
LILNIDVLFFYVRSELNTVIFGKKETSQEELKFDSSKINQVGTNILVF